MLRCAHSFVRSPTCSFPSSWGSEIFLSYFRRALNHCGLIINHFYSFHLSEKAIRGVEERLSHFYYLTGSVKKVVDERKENRISSFEPDLLELMMSHVTDGNVKDDFQHMKGNFKKQMTLSEVI